jgi:hypothetical protein
MGERLLVERILAEPDRPVPGGFELTRGCTLGVGCKQADRPEPDADAAERHSTVTVFARFRG